MLGLPLRIALFVFLQCASADTNEAGRRFLEENGKKEGVITFPEPQAFGAQYKILRNGTGVFTSIAGKTRCKVGYRATTIDGTEFDSSYKRDEYPDFAVTKNMDGMIMGTREPPMLNSQIIRNIYHVMGDMVEGDKWELYLPAELGFDEKMEEEKLKGIVFPGDVLIFELELVKLLGDARRARECDVETKNNCLLDEIDTIAKFHGKDDSDVTAELQRLKAQLKSSEPLKTEVKKLNKRTVKILKSVLSSRSAKAKSNAEL